MHFGKVPALTTTSIPSGDPDTRAVSVDGTGGLTYRELHRRQKQYANALLNLGVRPGDRVGILVTNSLEYFVLYFAIARLGAIAVRLNFRMAAPELQYVVEDSGCRVLCLHSRQIDLAESIHDDASVDTYVVFGGEDTTLPSWATSADTFADAPEDAPGVPEPHHDDPLMLMYTSGTTGRPKGALWTHDNALWFAGMQAIKWQYGPSTVAMTTGPLYHVGAFEDLLTAALLANGTAVCLSTGGFTVDRLVHAIRVEGVTDVLLYPFMLYELLELPQDRLHELSSLRRIVCGGDPVRPWAGAALGERLPGVELVQAYGLTEGGGMSTCLDHEFLRAHPDSVGRPLPLTEVCVVDDANQTVLAGEIGEVLVRSPSVCGSYWNAPDASATTFDDGWCRTGDLGRFSADGFLTITGRKKDMIRSGGENIYPAEVENVLSSHSAVYDVAVVATHDDKLLEVGCAVVVLADHTKVDDEELVGYCRERLAGYKCPKYFVRCEQLPRNASGKVLKYVLRERYGSTGTLPTAKGAQGES